MKMLSFGEILWDVYPSSKAIGGASLNLAAHAALLGNDAYLATAIGDDELGKEALEVARKLKINDKFIFTLSDKETGAVIVTLNEKGIPSYEIKDNVAYDFIKQPEIGRYCFDVLAFGSLALRHNDNKKTLEAILSANSFSEIYTDLNIRLPHSTKKSVNFCLSNATIVKVSDEELPTVSGWIFSKEYSPEDFAIEIAKKYSKIKLIIITMGEKGSFAFDTAKAEFYYCDAIATKVVSTVGAGDSFGAAFLTKYFQGMDINTCLNFASKLSSYVCSKKDAVPDFIEFI